MQQTTTRSHSSLQIVDEIKSETANFYLRPLEVFNGAMIKLEVSSSKFADILAPAGSVTLLQDGATQKWHHVTLQHTADGYVVSLLSKQMVM